jgi:hypothetical protein
MRLYELLELGGLGRDGCKWNVLHAACEDRQLTVKRNASWLMDVTIDNSGFIENKKSQTSYLLCFAERDHRPHTWTIDTLLRTTNCIVSVLSTRWDWCGNTRRGGTTCTIARMLSSSKNAHEDFRDETDTSKIGESYSLVVVDYDAYHMLGQGNDKQWFKVRNSIAPTTSYRIGQTYLSTELLQ